MKNNRMKKESGVALISVLLMLVLLMIVAFGLIFMAETDTAINGNYRSEQQAYFAAKAGIEEVRDRMRRSTPNTLDPNPNTPGSISWLPTTLPSNSGGVLYVINQVPGQTLVEPWTAGSKYKDDELCHDGYVIAGIADPFSNPGGVPADNVRCPNPPTGTTWYSKPTSTASGQQTSTLPFNGTSAAVPYKWVRVTWKQDNSIQGTPAQPYTVDGTATNSSTAALPVCWDGSKENLLQSPATNCESMDPVAMRPVYLTTALAVASGSRRMIQAELAKTAIPTVPAALALDGPEAYFLPVTSAGSTVVGWDAAPTPCPPAGNWPSVGTYTEYDAGQIAYDVNHGGAKPANWTGGPANNQNFNAINIGPWGTATEQYKDGTGLSYANCPSNPPPFNLAPFSPFCPGTKSNLNRLATVSGLKALVNTITQAADTIVPIGGTTPLPMGTDTDPKITVFQGDFNYSGNAFIGAGILLVQGKVIISGTPTFDGVVYIIGKGDFTTSGNASYGGQVLVANIIDLPPNPPNAAIVPVLQAYYGPAQTTYPADTPGSPKFTGGGGGGAGGVNYNSCKANLGNDRIPYRVLATREIQY